jgi:hypothetical protein
MDREGGYGPDVAELARDEILSRRVSDSCSVIREELRVV